MSATGAERQRVTMIIGMHRSGTSFLTGSLQQAGLELGKFSPWNPHNLKGNRENIDFVNLHDAMLVARDCSWDSPPADAVTWTENERRDAMALVEGYRGVPHWGFKDPRATLFAEGWLELLPHLEFVGIFRHPNAVHRSLDARGGMIRSRANGLWASYNRRLLAIHARKPFPVLCFDDAEETLLRKLDAVLVEHGLTPVTHDRFFSAELKHHATVDEPLPAELAALHDQLHAIAL